MNLVTDRRIVITGMGVISPLGLTVDEFWSGLISGKSGIGYITYFDTSDFPVKVAAEIHGFDPTKYMNPKMADRAARFSQFAIATAKMAIDSSGLDFASEVPERVGVCTANTIDVQSILSENERLKNRGIKRVNPLFVSRTGAHVSAVQIGMLYGAKGPNSNVNCACASGAEAMATAYDTIKLGYADVMIAGGTEACLIDLTLAGMYIVGAVSGEEDPTKASRPFDLNRSGFVFGEGSGIVVMETLEHAKNRGAHVLAEFAGVARSFDAYNDTAPNPETEAIAMRNALNDAGVMPEEVDYINAHGTGTKLNDISETEAIKTVFGARAYKIPISSNKSMIGHIIHSAGSIEAIASVLTINKGVIPPTINYETPDPECDLDYVPNVSRNAEVNICLTNSFGMGGQNCCLVLKRFIE